MICGSCPVAVVDRRNDVERAGAEVRRTCAARQSKLMFKEHLERITGLQRQGPSVDVFRQWRVGESLTPSTSRGGMRKGRDSLRNASARHVGEPAARRSGARHSPNVFGGRDSSVIKISDTISSSRRAWEELSFIWNQIEFFFFHSADLTDPILYELG